MKIKKSWTELADEGTDVYLLYTLYWISMREENRDKLGYKAALMVIFFSILSTHLIAYSSIINMSLNLAHYEP